MKKISRSDEFIFIYNELDAFMRKALGQSNETEHTFLINEMGRRGNRLFEIHSYELRLFARLRNAIIHNPYQKDAHPIAEPHQETVKKYRYLKNLVINPPKALSIAIPGAKIFTATLDTNVQHILHTMIDKSYTHIPIIEEGKIIGIFGENTLFCYLAKTKDCIITNDFTMREFREFLSVEKHLNEYFEFVPRDALITEIEEIFEKGLKSLKRIAVVYITEHGKPDEKLLGMITSWDLAGSRQN